MAVAIVHRRALAGVRAPVVTVEVHLAGGSPGVHLVGLPEAEVRETRDRVRAALQNVQFEFPARKVMDDSKNRTNARCAGEDEIYLPP